VFLDVGAGRGGENLQKQAGGGMKMETKGVTINVKGPWANRTCAGVGWKVQGPDGGKGGKETVQSECRPDAEA